VTETLVQIAQGVKAAQALVVLDGAVINPSLSGAASINSQHGLLPTHGGVAARVVNFDVALTVNEVTGTKGGIGVFVGAVTLGSSGQSNAENVSVSHVKFSVPMSLPVFSG